MTIGNALGSHKPDVKAAESMAYGGYVNLTHPSSKERRNPFIHMNKHLFDFGNIYWASGRACPARIYHIYRTLFGGVFYEFVVDPSRRDLVQRNRPFR